MFLVGLCTLLAVPAHKGSVRLTQPDGTTVTIRLVGDEYLHFNMTDDGYSVVKNADDYYVYAQLDADGQLQPTTMVAHDTSLRTAEETAWLANVKKRLTPRMTEEKAQEKENEQKRQARARAQHRAAQYDYTNFRGLVILVEFSDKQFSRTDYKDIMNGMINQENYTGYTDTNGHKQNFVGSVRDYFSDQSNGQFQPQFDVYGPYQVNYRANQGGQRSSQILNAAVSAADADINFADYDRDGNGFVDMIYFILAGNGANYGGNDQNLWWPHRSAITNGWNYVRKDNVYLWDYASSVELYGYTAYPSTVTLDGIGTICHEFGHVLGLPDFYDADYEQSGGESHHPGEWSVMAGGSYNNYGRQPVGYSLFERYAVGFTTPEVINSEGSYTLPSIATSNTGYRINTPQNKEFFMLENRQQDQKWNQYVPGHGMLVFRVDSTNASIWENNQVNNNPAHNYYELVRAYGYRNGDTGSDPFPGTRQVRTLNNTTSPANLLTWTGKETPWGLDNIREQSGQITFNVVNVNVLKQITLPDTASVGLGLGLRLTPERYPDSAPYTLAWSSADEHIATVSEEGVVTGISVGETDITVTANDNPALSATCHVTVHETIEFSSIADFKTLAEGDEASLRLTDAQVLIVHNGGVYLRDSTGAIVVSDLSASSLQQGDVVNGRVYGQYSTLNRVPQLKVINEQGVNVAPGTEAKPLEVSLDSLNDSHYANYLVLQKMTLQRVTSGALTGVFATTDEHRVRIFNTFGLSGWSMPTNYVGKTYKIPGILVTRVAGGEVYDELALMGPPEEEVKQKFSLDYQIGEGGAVLFGEQALTGTGSLEMTEGESLELLVTPAEDYEVEELLLDGERIEEAKVVISNVSADHTLSITFRETPPIEDTEDPTAIGLPSASGSKSSNIFTATGRRVTSPARPGFYIVRSGSAVKKVVVR